MEAVCSRMVHRPCPIPDVSTRALVEAFTPFAHCAENRIRRRDSLHRPYRQPPRLIPRFNSERRGGRDDAGNGDGAECGGHESRKSGGGELHGGFGGAAGAQRVSTRCGSVFEGECRDRGDVQGSEVEREQEKTSVDLHRLVSLELLPVDVFLGQLDPYAGIGRERGTYENA